MTPRSRCVARFFRRDCHLEYGPRFGFRVQDTCSRPDPARSLPNIGDVQHPTWQLRGGTCWPLPRVRAAKAVARLSLVAALGDTPGWFTPLSPEPRSHGFRGSAETNQFLWASMVDFPFAFAFRAELEFRAQGNPSWNTGVDYRRQFEHSADAAEVRALYEHAGLDLDADLTMLNETARISADQQAANYLKENITYNGEIHIPVLTLHTTGDGLVVVQNESAYRDVVGEEGNERFLRRRFISRAGHCAFTPAETIAAVKALLNRLDTGRNGAPWM